MTLLTTFGLAQCYTAWSKQTAFLPEKTEEVDDCRGDA